MGDYFSHPFFTTSIRKPRPREEAGLVYQHPVIGPSCSAAPAAALEVSVDSPLVSVTLEPTCHPVLLDACPPPLPSILLREFSQDADGPSWLQLLLPILSPPCVSKVTCSGEFLELQSPRHRPQGSAHPRGFSCLPAPVPCLNPPAAPALPSRQSVALWSFVHLFLPWPVSQRSHNLSTGLAQKYVKFIP